MELIDHTDELHDFADTAAMLANLDLIITVDTAVAHLAGALARPAWVLLPYMPDWRWMLDRADSPWYPSLRLFRQKMRGDWAEVMERVKRELESRRVS
jgi:ADP-heptose:LPS heptosyltransferase